MTLYEFNALGEDEKAMAVWDGVLAGTRREQLVTVQLYVLPEFYAEVYYNQISNEITRLRAFICQSQLEPYLDQINIEGLLL